MIEIIIEKVEMPDFNKRKFQKGCNNDKWSVVDTETDTVIYKGKYEDVCLISHNLNKKFYRDNNFSN